MHARLDQLLSLRDGAPVDAHIRSHVQRCDVCLAEADRLAGLRHRMHALPAIDPPRDFWKEIEARAERPPARRYGVSVAAAAVVLVAVALSYLGLRDGGGKLHRVAKLQPSAAVIAEDAIDELIAQSRELEAVLAYLPERPHVERVSTASTVDSIEQRIQWLDWQLANGSEAGLDRMQAQRLWTERVDLMDSLVKVRYAETAPLMF